ncbi:hypothetical protein V7152_14900 [Neobacillus drentensis]|uniref:hypothetical protein n=1 Tax=Neobacillus drentensis TaxID=220684 RepID=UPI003000C2B2
MKYTTQFECMDKDCNTVVLGTHRQDGIICPRCNGPVLPKPFEQHKKIGRAVYRCLCCDHQDEVQVTKDEYSEVKVCPKCNGAFVDLWKIAKYKKKMNYKVNFNEPVKVQLTEAGIYILKQRHEELKRKIGRPNLEPVDIKIDDEGYSSFQLWSLMNVFGNHMSLGCVPPFKSDIIICNGELTND